jgi:hypothetical protein
MRVSWRSRLPTLLGGDAYCYIYRERRRYIARQKSAPPADVLEETWTFARSFIKRDLSCTIGYPRGHPSLDLLDY